MCRQKVTAQEICAVATMRSRSNPASGFQSVNVCEWSLQEAISVILSLLFKTCLSIIWLVLPVLFWALSTVRGGARCYQSHNLRKQAQAVINKNYPLIRSSMLCCMYHVIPELWGFVRNEWIHKETGSVSLTPPHPSLLHQLLALLPFPHLCSSFQKPDKRRICTRRAAPS